MVESSRLRLADDACGVAEQELEHHRRGKLGRGAEPAVRGVELRAERLHRLVEHLRVDRILPRGHDGAAQVLADAGRDPPHLLGLGGPHLAERLEHLAEGGLPVPRLVREVGAREERHALVVQHAGHRPAAVAGHRGRGLHVDRVDVGPLLAVDLDADEVLVEVGRGVRVLERLVRHHVAPVARGVPDGEQHRRIAAPAPRRKRRAPTPTNPPDSPRVGAGRGWSRWRGGWPFLMTPDEWHVYQFLRVMHESDAR